MSLRRLAGNDRKGGREIVRGLVRVGLAASLLIALARGGYAQRVAFNYDSPEEQEFRRQWAFLVGVEKYDKLPSLKYTTNDVVQLHKTLTERGSFQWDHVQSYSDQDQRPVSSLVKSNLQAFLRRQAPEDRVIVYFSGHGYRDADGRLYLATADCDPARPGETSVPVEWLREVLSACAARQKLLVLDACHAGTEKGAAAKAVAAQDLGEPFRDVENVVTLASSTGEETSQIWFEREQSLFTYWLNEGLKGHADEQNDGALDIDELYKFVHRNVTRTARRLGSLQTPVRIVRSGVQGVPVIMKLRPLGLEELLSAMAEQLAWAIEDRNMPRVGVLEFAAEASVGKLLGGNYGLLGKMCADRLRDRLASMGGDKFTIVDEDRLKNTLARLQFTLEDLGNDESLQKLSEGVNGMPAMALGSLRGRKGRLINLQCRLMKTDTGDLVASAGGPALLTEDEWAMLGGSAVLPPPPKPFDKPQYQSEDELIDDLDRRAKGPHPLRDPNFQWPIRIRVNNQYRKGVFQGNDYLVPVNKGEELEIEIQNRHPQLVFVKLLVDGLNTLPEPIMTKGVKTYEIAKRVSLKDARPWVLQPASRNNPRGVYAIRGFVTDVGAGGELRRFTVVDAVDSVAARKEFTDQIGIITAAIYLPMPPQPRMGSPIAGMPLGGPGMDMGRRMRENLTVAEDVPPMGDLQAVVHIKYVDAASLPAGQ